MEDEKNQTRTTSLNGCRNSTGIVCTIAVVPLLATVIHHAVAYNILYAHYIDPLMTRNKKGSGKQRRYKKKNNNTGKNLQPTASVLTTMSDSVTASSSLATTLSTPGGLPSSWWLDESGQIKMDAFVSLNGDAGIPMECMIDVESDDEALENDLEAMILDRDMPLPYDGYSVEETPTACIAMHMTDALRIFHMNVGNMALQASTIFDVVEAALEQATNGDTELPTPHVWEVLPMLVEEEDGEAAGGANPLAQQPSLTKQNRPQIISHKQANMRVGSSPITDETDGRFMIRIQPWLCHASRMNEVLQAAAAQSTATTCANSNETLPVLLERVSHIPLSNMIVNPTKMVARAHDRLHPATVVATTSGSTEHREVRRSAAATSATTSASPANNDIVHKQTDEEETTRRILERLSSAPLMRVDIIIFGDHNTVVEPSNLAILQGMYDAMVTAHGACFIQCVYPRIAEVDITLNGASGISSEGVAKHLPYDRIAGLPHLSHRLSLLQPPVVDMVSQYVLDHPDVPIIFWSRPEDDFSLDALLKSVPLR